MGRMEPVDLNRTNSLVSRGRAWPSPHLAADVYPRVSRMNSVIARYLTKPTSDLLKGVLLSLPLLLAGGS